MMALFWYTYAILRWPLLVSLGNSQDAVGCTSGTLTTSQAPPLSLSLLSHSFMRTQVRRMFDNVCFMYGTHVYTCSLPAVFTAAEVKLEFQVRVAMVSNQPWVCAPKHVIIPNTGMLLMWLSCDFHVTVMYQNTFEDVEVLCMTLQFIMLILCLSCACISCDLLLLSSSVFSDCWHKWTCSWSTLQWGMWECRSSLH